MAQQMTAGKGLGLADMMVKQMTSGQTMPADDCWPARPGMRNL
nr:hypothetical protein [Escherichia coli]